MSILQPAFNILIICGCWMPPIYCATWKRIAYFFYTISVFFLLHSFCVSQFLNVIQNVKSADELSDSFYMFIASILSCCKIITLLLNRRNIEILSRKLEEEPCKPTDAKEISIQNKFDKSIGSIFQKTFLLIRADQRKNSHLKYEKLKQRSRPLLVTSPNPRLQMLYRSVTIFYTILVEMTVFCMIVSSLLTDFKTRTLAYKAWLPFNHSVPSLYYIAYVHQIVALIGTSLLNVACDVIICGLCVHICSQQEILAYRLNEITRNSRLGLGKFVRFHNYLYGRYASLFQEKFKLIIGIQLVSSTLVVCFILYELANTPVYSMKYLQFVLYMACMMTQIYFYCWYGNQLKLKVFIQPKKLLNLSCEKSLLNELTVTFILRLQEQSVEIVDRIFELEWVKLDNSTKKSLMMTMCRANSPIELTSAYVFAMDLNTFVSILKMSYSVYNLLQRTKKSSEDQ
ncbi:uncharacterized protein LOC143183500 [Calliopsis andreniformis]|uniref:uncharacterized protein LOC143183500 n=1 Tax=Calliopsis andreniformis TaxID=337506 RepID=UPI003FCCFA65